MTLVEKVRHEFQHIAFEPSERFQWSPENQIIYYNDSLIHANWSLLHEIGHVLSEHKSYTSDIGLLKMEVEAWQKALEIAKKYKIKIDNDHIEKCLDSYRDWIYKRSTCPTCAQAGIEKTPGVYSCINCKNKWKVSAQKFCRVYRKTVPSYPETVS